MNSTAPEGWRETVVADVADIRISNVDKKSAAGEVPVRLCNYIDVYNNEYITGALDFMEATATASEIARFSVEVGDVMITKDSETPDDIGVPAVAVWSDSRFVCGYHLALFKPHRDKVDPVFLAKQLGLPRIAEYYGRLACGSTRYGLSNSGIAKTPLLLPSVAHQQKIARILTTLDNLIEKTEALIAKYQAIKQGMMHDLFTRGVDEHGHLRPSYAEAPNLYKQSELGWIPKEWDAQELGAVIPRAEYGISVSLDDVEGIPVLRMNNLTNGRIDVTDIKCSHSYEAQRLRLQNEDVLFNRTNSIDHVGRTSIWRDELPEASFASYLVRLIPDFSKLLPQYLVLWLNLPEIQIAIRQFATPGVHQVNINPTNLRRTMITLPSGVWEQCLICKVIQQQDTEISREAQYLAKLRLQKSGLMQDLLTGKSE